MTNRKILCLNMIVMNEMANLERCLGAIADHIGCWVIGDTGSSDGTRDFIKSFFAARNLPGELHRFPSHDFAQARNARRMASNTRRQTARRSTHWQRERYLAEFGLPPERCLVLRNATEVGADLRRWEAAPIWRCAHTSTPFRGLSVLLDAWQRLSPANAELHVWKLYLVDDGPYAHLYERARSMPGVILSRDRPESRGSRCPACTFSFTQAILRKRPASP